MTETVFNSIIEV